MQSIFSDHNGMKLEISNKSKTGKFTKLWKLNIILLNNQCFKEELTRDIRKYLETNENENTTNQSLWDAVKAVLRGKFIAINAYIKNKEIKKKKTQKLSTQQPNFTT